MMPTAARLTSEIVRSGGIPTADRAAMRALMAAAFRGFDPACFERDLEDKPWAIVLRDAAGLIAGFSTLDLMTANIDGRVIRAVYSGDTIIATHHRATTALPRAFLRFLAVHTTIAADAADWFWFYVCKGFRTYRFLPLFYRNFHPHPDRAMPDFERKVMDGLARRRFGNDYDAATGVVRVAGDYALADTADLTPARMADPFVRLFATRNPGWPRGEELVCLAPLDMDNLLERPRRWLEEEIAAVP